MPRRKIGSTLIDTPAALWLLFVLFLVPMIDLATVFLRYTFMVAASRDAAHAAAKAKTFRTDISTSERSAINMASSAATATASSFREIRVDRVVTQMVITDLSNQAVTRRTTPLTAPADTGINLYEIETTVVGQINPLVNFTAGAFPGIPGLSAPVPVSVTSREFFENPQGLNQ